MFLVGFHATKNTAGASMDASLSRERRGSASFRNIKAIAEDKGEKKGRQLSQRTLDVSTSSQLWAAG